MSRKRVSVLIVVVMVAMMPLLWVGCSSRPGADAVPEQTPADCVKLFEHHQGTMMRWVDSEAGIVCYRFVYREGIDCIPLSSCDEAFQRAPCK